MRPFLVEWLGTWLGPTAAALVAPTYFTFAAIGALVGTALAVRRARRDGDDVASLLRVLAIAYVAVIAAGIVVPMLFDLVGQLLAGRAPRLRWAGMVAYAGIGGGLLATWLATRRRAEMPPARFFDIIAVPVAATIAVVRLGCFAAGCDYGKVAAVPWAVRYPRGSAAWHDHVHAGLLPPTRDLSLPVHPTQLYEAAIALAICILVTALAARRPAPVRAPGRLFAVTLVLYALGRLVTEALRGDGSRGLWGPLSTSQIVSLVVLVALIAVVIWRGLGARARTLAVAAALLVGASGASAYAQPGQPGQPGQPAPYPQQPAPGQPAPYPQQPAPGQPAPSPQQPAPGQPAPYPRQPAPGQPTPSPQQPAPYPQQPAPGQPAPYPQQPAPGQPAPSPQQPAAGQTPPTGARRTRPQHGFDIGGLFGFSSSINRIPGQVPMLTAAGLYATYSSEPPFAIGLELERAGNSVATHDTFGFVVAHRVSLRPDLELVSRVGLGVTRVAWIDPSFVDVPAFDARLTAGVDYALNDRWSLVAQPVAFDFMVSGGIGGLIATYQVRLGVAYGTRRSSVPPPGRTAPVVVP